MLGKLASGELCLVVGTHALIEPDVGFARLAVAVVDEQHRFGVRQRAALDAQGRRDGARRPHVLHMTATPIPRTLALARYGDLDRHGAARAAARPQPIETHVAGGERERARAYERIREELRAGRQAFVVCPLVEESEALQARAATRRVRAPARRASSRTSASCCCTARCARARSRRRWRRSPPAAPTCSSRRR